jgi:hypothetical protein
MALPDAANDRELAKFIEMGTGTTGVRVTSPMRSTLATVNVGSGVASGTTASAISGMVYKITEMVYKITECVGTMSGTPGTQNTYLIDSKGGTIAALTAQAESGTLTVSTIVPITTDMSWRTDMTGDPSGTQDAAAGVNVVLDIHYQT